jgi:beta-glucosidase
MTDIHALFHTLSRQEKIGQLLQLAPFLFVRDLAVEVAGFVRHLNLSEQKIFQSGSVLGIGSAEEMIDVQTKYLAKSSKKIPLIFMADIIHGYKTVFPVPIGLASSFQPELAFQTARVSALEASTSGIHVTFSPMADLARDPRWGRVVESFGEDPHLISTMAEAMVKGYQHDGIEKEGNLASCVKHFAAYGAAEAGRDYNTADVSRLSLHQFYLPGYKAAIQAGARMIMTSFNTVDGIPATTNKHLLRDVLRTLWGFTGVTISDYDSLQQTIAHGHSEDQRQAAFHGIQAGLDIEMASTTYTSHLSDLIDAGEVDERLVDEAVLRILELKRDLGLFDNPFKGANSQKAKEIVLSKDHLERALEAARESIVLLKNNQVLPLKQTQKIAIVGPYADERNMIGPWHWHGRRDLHTTLKEVFADQAVFVKKAFRFDECNEDDIAQIRSADVVLFALGEHEWQSGEAHSRSDIRLPFEQHTLLNLSSDTQAKVVVLFNGRPLDLQNIDAADAILEAWFPGSMAAEAIREILLGITNPSGKLPITFPKTLGQVPIYYNRQNTGRPYLGKDDRNEYVSKYLDIDNDPAYPFGHGLSYSNFVYGEIRLSKDVLTSGESLYVSFDVTNESDIPGKETAMLFLKDHHGRVVRPVLELKAFRKEHFLPGETKTLQFVLTQKDFGFLLEDGTFVVEPGWFTVSCGPDAKRLQNKTFRLNP